LLYSRAFKREKKPQQKKEKKEKKEKKTISGEPKRKPHSPHEIELNGK